MRNLEMGVIRFFKFWTKILLTRRSSPIISLIVRTISSAVSNITWGTINRITHCSKCGFCCTFHLRIIWILRFYESCFYNKAPLPTRQFTWELALQTCNSLQKTRGRTSMIISTIVSKRFWISWFGSIFFTDFEVKLIPSLPSRGQQDPQECRS